MSIIRLSGNIVSSSFRAIVKFLGWGNVSNPWGDENETWGNK